MSKLEEQDKVKSRRLKENYKIQIEELNNIYKYNNISILSKKRLKDFITKKIIQFENWNKEKLYY